jgi:hypothetical protein
MLRITSAETRNKVGESTNRETLKTTKDHYGALPVSSEFGRHRANETGVAARPGVEAKQERRIA